MPVVNRAPHAPVGRAGSASNFFSSSVISIQNPKSVCSSVRLMTVQTLQCVLSNFFAPGAPHRATTGFAEALAFRSNFLPRHLISTLQSFPYCKFSRNCGSAQSEISALPQAVRARPSFGLFRKLPIRRFSAPSTNQLAGAHRACRAVVAVAFGS